MTEGNDPRVREMMAAAAEETVDLGATVAQQVNASAGPPRSGTTMPSATLAGAYMSFAHGCIGAVLVIIAAGARFLPILER